MAYLQLRWDRDLLSCPYQNGSCNVLKLLRFHGKTVEAAKTEPKCSEYFNNNNNIALINSFARGILMYFRSLYVSDTCLGMQNAAKREQKLCLRYRWVCFSLREGIKLVDFCFKGAQNTCSPHANLDRSEFGMQHFSQSLHSSLPSRLRYYSNWSKGMVLLYSEGVLIRVSNLMYLVL